MDQLPAFSCASLLSGIAVAARSGQWVESALGLEFEPINADQISVKPTLFNYARLRSIIRAVRAEPWEFLSWSEMGVVYRIIVVVLPALVFASSVVLADASFGLSTMVFNQQHLAWTFGVTLGSSILALRVDDSAFLDHLSVIPLALALSGNPLEALLSALLIISLSVLRKPRVAHLVVVQFLLGFATLLLVSCAMALIGSASVPGGAFGENSLSLLQTWTIEWFVAALVSGFLVVMVDSVFDVLLLAGGYSETRFEAALTFRDHALFSVTTILPASILLAAVLPMHMPLTLLLVAVPLLLSGDATTRSRASAALIAQTDARVTSDRLRHVFESYVPASVVDQLVEQADRVNLGGEQHTVSVLFLDIRGFTAWSEHQTPQEVVDELNALLSILTDSVFEHEGTLDKFTGDGLMAFWGAPLEQPDHAERACWAAIAMLSYLEAYNDIRQDSQRFRLGIGVHTGEVVAGNVGHSHRHDYTVIGDTVNLASRVESATKEVGTQLLITDETFFRISEPLQRMFASHGALNVSGREQSVHVHRYVPSAHRQHLHSPALFPVAADPESPAGEKAA